MPIENLLQFVLSRLENCRGDWKSIAEKTGVPYSTLTKIAQGHTENPGVQHVQKLANYFREQDEAGVST